MVTLTVDQSQAKLAKLLRHYLALFAAAALLLAPAVAWAQGRAWTEARNKMVDEDIVGAGVKNPRVIDAMRKTPRHEFVPLRDQRPLPISTWPCRSAKGRPSRRPSSWPT